VTEDLHKELPSKIWTILPNLRLQKENTLAVLCTQGSDDRDEDSNHLVNMSLCVSPHLQRVRECKSPFTEGKGASEFAGTHKTGKR